MPPIIQRAAFIIPSTGTTHNPNISHLFFVLTNPCAVGNVLVVPLGSQKRRPDLSCEVRVGDHPYVRAPSMILYKHCKLMVVKDIESGLNSGFFTYDTPASEILFASI